MSGGSGGTGGGIDWGRGETVGVFCDCRETTGGSFAKTSRNIARKSSMLDFYNIVSLCTGAKEMWNTTLTSWKSTHLARYGW